MKKYINKFILLTILINCLVITNNTYATQYTDSLNKCRTFFWYNSVPWWLINSWNCKCESWYVFSNWREHFSYLPMTSWYSSSKCILKNKIYDNNWTSCKTSNEKIWCNFNWTCYELPNNAICVNDNINAWKCNELYIEKDWVCLEKNNTVMNNPINTNENNLTKKLQIVDTEKVNGSNTWVVIKSIEVKKCSKLKTDFISKDSWICKNYIKWKIYGKILLIISIFGITGIIFQEIWERYKFNNKMIFWFYWLFIVFPLIIINIIIFYFL